MLKCGRGRRALRMLRARTWDRQVLNSKGHFHASTPPAALNCRIEVIYSAANRGLFP